MLLIKNIFRRSSCIGRVINYIGMQRKRPSGWFRTLPTSRIADGTIKLATAGLLSSIQ